MSIGVYSSVKSPVLDFECASLEGLTNPKYSTPYEDDEGKTEADQE